MSEADGGLEALDSESGVLQACGVIGVASVGAMEELRQCMPSNAFALRHSRVLSPLCGIGPSPLEPHLSRTNCQRTVGRAESCGG